MGIGVLGGDADAKGVSPFAFGGGPILGGRKISGGGGDLGCVGASADGGLASFNLRNASA